MHDEDWAIELGRGMGPARLGLERTAMLEQLRAAGIAFDDDDLSYVDLEDEEFSLTFDEEEPHRLLQIEIASGLAQIGSMTIIGQRPHEVIDLLRVPADETLWRSDCLHIDEPFAIDETPLTPASDEELLGSGTLWITSQGLGLGLHQGVVAQILLRLPQHVPQRGLGGFTSAQRTLLEQPNLEQLLAPPPPHGSWERSIVRGGLTLVFAAALGVLFWQALLFQQRWNNASIAEGVVSVVQPPPPDPFPSEFTVDYQDQHGQPHQVVLHTADVYMVRAVGDKVEIHYLPEAPDQPMGPARVRDAAFLKFVPYGLGLGAVYLVLLTVSSILLRILLPPPSHNDR